MTGRSFPWAAPSAITAAMISGAAVHAPIVVANQALTVISFHLRSRPAVKSSKRHQQSRDRGARRHIDHAQRVEELATRSGSRQCWLCVN